MQPHNRAVFLDRDGVLTVPEFREGRSFAPKRLADFRLYDEAAECLHRMRAAGFRLVVVTNQPDVGNGLVDIGVVQEMHRILAAALPVDAIEACFHRQVDRCSCRKPKPGMLLAAALRLGLDCARSFLIGDRESDMEAGRAVGCTCILIDHGYNMKFHHAPDYHTYSLLEATNIILNIAL